MALSLASQPSPFGQKKLKLSKADFWRTFGVGFIGYGISLGFPFVGTDLSTAANGSLVTSATPGFVLIFAALIVASLGMLAVIDPRSAQLDSSLFCRENKKNLIS